jgi:hypothetical protein
VIKAEPDSDHELWPVSSVNEDTAMVEEPVTFLFVSVNGEVSVGFMSCGEVFWGLSLVNCSCMQWVMCLSVVHEAFYRTLCGGGSLVCVLLYTLYLADHKML